MPPSRHHLVNPGAPVSSSPCSPSRDGQRAPADLLAELFVSHALPPDLGAKLILPSGNLVHCALSHPITKSSPDAVTIDRASPRNTSIFTELPTVMSP